MSAIGLTPSSTRFLSRVGKAADERNITVHDTLPRALQYTQALGPTITAVVVAIIASIMQYRMWTTANDKLRLDLFDRRLRIWDALHTEIMVTNGSIDDLDRNIKAVLQGISGYNLLFDEVTANKIGDLELQLMLIRSKLRSYDPGFDIHHYIINNLSDVNRSVSSLRSVLLKQLRFIN